MTDNIGFGRSQRLSLNQKVLDGTSSFRDAFYTMLHSVTLPFQECIDLLLANIKLDPGFASFYSWCKSNSIPVIILSGGMEPIVRALLEKLMGEETAGEIEIISNHVKLNEETGGWEIEYRDER